jgi:hypothetical protein
MHWKTRGPINTRLRLLSFIKQNDVFWNARLHFIAHFLPEVSEELGTFCRYNYTVQDRISGPSNVGAPVIWVEESISKDVAHFSSKYLTVCTASYARRQKPTSPPHHHSGAKSDVEDLPWTL